MSTKERTIGVLISKGDTTCFAQPPELGSPSYVHPQKSPFVLLSLVVTKLDLQCDPSETVSRDTRDPETLDLSTIGTVAVVPRTL